MKKNKITSLIVLSLFGLLYVQCGFGSQENTLARVEGWWTTKQDLSSDKTKSLYKPINIYEQREDWYQLTSYIAEPWCTVTSMSIVCAAVKYMPKKPVGSAGVLFAGLASAASHAIPRDWLHKQDHIAAFAAIAGIAYDCNILSIKRLVEMGSNPLIMRSSLITGALYVADVSLAHMKIFEPYRRRYQTLFHCLWHLSVPWLISILLSLASQQ